MIEARHLSKRYGQTVAVDDACFAVRPGPSPRATAASHGGKARASRAPPGFGA